ncbi:4857_t:CDS:2 [Diversispora eburnea]|uniref:4857_t:CDS:1 n=1 Tax=Diversispora eburnea TaxID=1213867 RepID=A0A9N9FF23_9GLOM|nr:4857_t:CDS:2 [Diversispora eburnea]
MDTLATICAHGFISPLCITSQKINQFLVHPIETLPFALSFYLWYALVKKDANIEKKCSLYISSFVWLSAIIHAICLSVASRNDENFGTKVESYLCVARKRTYSMLLIIIIFTLLFTIAMSIMQLGHDDDIWSWCYTFSGPVGILLWSIFGTSKKAAIFLPCYYVTPVSLNSYDIPQEHMTVTDNLSDSSMTITTITDEGTETSRNSRNCMLEKEDLDGMNK